MKKILKIIYLISIYFILVICNNCRNIFSNIRNDIGIFENTNFFSIAIIIAMGAFIVLIAFNKFKLKKNKLLISSFFVTVSLCILNGIFLQKNIENYIILYFFIILEAYTLSKITKQQFNISVFLFAVILIFLMIIISIFNLLVISKYLLIIISIFSLVYLIYCNLKSNSKDTEIENDTSIGIIIFSIMFVLFVLGGINRYIHVYDEYSFWAFDAKVVMEYDKLSSYGDVMSPKSTYPQALTIWHYFINIFTNNNNESHLYIGLSIFILIALMPCFSFIKNKNKFFTTLFTITIYFSCYLFGNVYNYTCLYADYALSAVFASSIVFTLIFENDAKIMKRYLFLGLTLCCFIKPSGIILAGSYIIIKIIEDFLSIKKINFKDIINCIKNVIKKWWKISIALILLFIGWSIYIRICNKVLLTYYNFKLIPPSLDPSLSAKLNMYSLSKTFYNLIKSFSDTILNGVININLYQYILLMITFGILIMYLKSKNIDLKRMIPYFIGYVIFYVFTFISMFLTFSKYEAENLASFGRYLNALHYGILILFVVYIFKNISTKNYSKKNLACILILLAILINIPIKNILFFVYDYGTDRKNTQKLSYERQEKFKIVNENTNKDSKVYVLDQKDTDGIMAMWYSRYYLFPRIVNASSDAIGWKIRTIKNGDDLQDWGLTGRELAEHLDNYNFSYLFLYTYDEEMFKEINFMLDRPYTEIIDKYTLFKIEKYEVGIVLVPVS